MVASEPIFVSESMPTSLAKSVSKKRGSGASRPYQGVLGLCIAFGAGYNISEFNGSGVLGGIVGIPSEAGSPDTYENCHCTEISTSL